MKKVMILPIVAFTGLVVFPSNSYALSCMDPQGMIEQYVEDGRYVIVTATPTENKEHVREKADKNDPNMQYDSGYSAQFIEIAESHKGWTPNSRWVYFERDSTWNYLCAGEPAPVNAEQVYVLYEEEGLFGVTKVAGVYGANSEIAEDIIDAIQKGSEDDTVVEVHSSDRTYWLTQLHDELKDMAFIMKVKLAEWNFWKSAK